ncbi:MAG: vWA domain-containing protein [Magnetospiraceae bacterium]
MTELTLICTPLKPAVMAGFDNQLDVLVRLRAPALPDTAPTRAPLNLAIVLDRSGSMSGQPLAEAKRCAHYVINRLGPQDRAALVVYDNEITVAAPSTPVLDKKVFHAAIDRVQSGGTTALHGGWLAGAGQVSEAIDPETITRVILLSDGQANVGLQDVDKIAAQCAQLAEAGVSTSTYGLGRSFNEDLMVAMARAGQGNAYYGQTAADLMDPFQEEFDLLSALCARRLRLRVAAAPGVTATVLNDLPMDADGAYRLLDLAYGGEAWAVVRLTIGADRLREAGESLAFAPVDLMFHYEDLGGHPHSVTAAPLALPVLPPAAFGAVPQDALVARRIAELEAANLQDAAQQAARHGDWQQVNTLLDQAKANAKDNPWLDQVVDGLRDLAAAGDAQQFAKETAYQSTKMRTRLAPAAEMADLVAAAPSYLRRKIQQGKGDV